MIELSERRAEAAELGALGALPLRARLASVEADGRLLVNSQDGRTFLCDILIESGAAGMALQVGDDLLVLPPSPDHLGIVLGRIGRYVPPRMQVQFTLETTESLTLKCGESSLELRADGKVLLKGDDVLIRAKGTQRIRAGNVAIN